MHIILAHGALGIFDEVIYLSIVVIFVGFMGVSWVRARNQTIEEDENTAEDAEQSPDHFKLD